MPLQNRVTPFGDIIATPERGTWLGNRGILHNDRRELLRTSQLRRWICCVLECKGIHRTVMTPHSYTELFFLDEATALAAGHRPCFECRRSDAQRFQAAWRAAIGPDASADAMDIVLDRDRKLRGGAKRTYRTKAAALPDGTFIAEGDAAWLLQGAHRYRWTPGGYTVKCLRPSGQVEVLTPQATVATIAAGYEPIIYPATKAIAG